MISLQAFVLAFSLAGANDPVLLDFYADWCGPCRSMDPTVQRLIADGYPVRKVNVEKEAQLVAQFRVARVPTFVMLAGGQEVHRVEGTASFEQLRDLMTAHKPAVASAATPSRGGSPTSPAADGIEAAHARALQATVRLKVDDPNGASFGTGTIIDLHDDEALVITCAHIFRDSQGRGEILIDLFAPGNGAATTPLRGQLIHADMEHDVAFVSLRPGIAIAPIRVAGDSHAVRSGDRVFSVGCDRGNPPTVRDSQITSINKYQGPANFQAAGAPVIGRSGGGLFTADGRLIGICNLADPEDDEGIYAALELVHQQLAKINQTRLFRGDVQLAGAGNQPPSSRPGLSSVPQPPTMADRMPIVPLTARNSPSVGTAVANNPAADGLQRLAVLLNEVGDDAEMICIVRSKRDPTRQNAVIVLDRPSRDLLDRIATETTPSSSASPTVLQASRGNSPAAIPPARLPGSASSNGQVLRGQSLR